MDDLLASLVKKYDCAGPRYTSYPPAPMFSEDFGAPQYEEAVRAREADTRNEDLSLYVHFPFCDSLCYFCGCTTFVTRNRDVLRRYVHSLKKEMQLFVPQLSAKRRVVQMHWGGGTPTYLSPGEIEDVGTLIRTIFPFTPDCEVSVEVDPRDLTYHHLKALRGVGFNRISLGVQDFNPSVQWAVNRLQSEFLSRQVVDWSRELGFSSINIDLIYGLPLQTAGSFIRMLDTIIDISPDRIAAYNFAYVPWMKKHQRLIHREDLPSPEEKIRILIGAIEKLSDAGYVYIGMDHFAKPDDELTIAQRNKTLHRNFQGYSTRAGSDLYGFGLSAIGHFGEYYAQNTKTLEEYSQALSLGRFATALGYRMSRDDLIRKHVIMKLMCDLRVDKRSVEERFGIVFDEYFGESLAKLGDLINDDLIAVTPDSIEVVGSGRLVLRNISMCFDAYSGESRTAQPLFSRTV